MHILFLLNVDIRQVQRVNKEMATLRQAGHAVSLVYLPAEPADPDPSGRLRSVSLWTRNLPKNLIFWPIKYAECVIQFAIAGIRLRPQALHCVDRLTLLPGLFIARVLGVPLVYDTQEVWSEVNSVLNRPRRIWLAFERYAAHRAFRVLVTDLFRLALSIELLKLPPSRMAVLMNLPNRAIARVDDNRNIRADSGFKDKTLLVYAGGISRGRHLEECILALGYLPASYALAIVGFGDNAYRAQLMQLAQDHGISDRVTMLPAVSWSELTAYIRTADCAFAFYEKLSINNLYCSPSKLFDALLAGVPVVGTDNPLIVEVLTALDAGQTVSDVNPKAIACAVAAAVTHDDLPTRRMRIATMARATYTWEQQEHVLLNIYRELEHIRL